MSNPVADTLLRKLRSDLIVIKKGIIDTKMVSNQLPEPIFKEVFLPFFLSQHPNEEWLMLLDQWIQIAGTAQLPVDIVDEKNNILFTVPPIYGTSMTKKMSKMRDGEHYSVIQERHQRTAQDFPTLAEGKIHDALDKKFEKHIRSVETGLDRYAGQWDVIFSYYGINTDEVEGRVINKEPEASGVEFDDD